MAHLVDHFIERNKLSDKDLAGSFFLGGRMCLDETRVLLLRAEGTCIRNKVTCY